MLNDGPKNLLEAIQAQLAIESFLKRHGIRDLTGDYGEMLAHETIGGKLMPPVHEVYDILHNEFGRVQVKTRRLASRLGGKISKETRAVFSGPISFDHLFHLILDEGYRVRDAILAPASEVASVTGANSGKIRLEQTRRLPSAKDLSKEAAQAEQRLYRRLG